MYGHPGAKLLFMGGEIAQDHEWAHDNSLDWHECNRPLNKGIQGLLRELNRLYREERALHEGQFSPEGFEWIAFDDTQNSVIAWVRRGREADEHIVIVGSFTPVLRLNYRVGAPAAGFYRELFNSDHERWGGSHRLNDAVVESYPVPWHGRSHSFSLTLPPFGLVMLKFERHFE
jgi:1,4-alpha-glucan branching enzyme